MGRTECPDLNGLQASLRLEKATPSTRAKWRSSRSAYSSVLEKCLTPPTLSETPGDELRVRDDSEQGNHYGQDKRDGGGRCGTVESHISRDAHSTTCQLGLT